MFVLMFPPAATGWLGKPDSDLEIKQPTRRPNGKWVHIAARAESDSRSTRPVASTRAKQRNRWISKGWPRRGGKGRSCEPIDRSGIVTRTPHLQVAPTTRGIRGRGSVSGPSQNIGERGQPGKTGPVGITGDMPDSRERPAWNRGEIGRRGYFG